MSTFAVFSTLLLVVRTTVSDPSAATVTTSSDARGLIVGGEQVDNPNDFPFYVSFENENRSLTCGGALVAPDMLVTATHCDPLIKRAFIGRYGRDVDHSTGYDIVQRIHHPRYDNDTLYFDFMLAKIDVGDEDMTVLSEDIVRLNNDPDVPSVGSTLSVVGLGYTIYNDPSSKPEFLRKTKLGTMSNTDCALAEDPKHPLIINYADRITPDMMCTKGDNTDTCTGDSGGPLVLEDGGDRDNRILVGLVSWGYYCNVMPGVNVRISHQYEWLRSNICTYSSAPPEYLGCDQAEPQPSPVVVVPSFEVDEVVDKTHMDVTISIQADRYPLDISWRLLNDRNQTIAGVSEGRYRIANQRYHHDMALSLGTTYRLVLHDAHGDGICCHYGQDGFIEIYAQEEAEDDRTILFHANGTFESTATFEFTTPATAPPSNSHHHDVGADTDRFAIGRVLNVSIHTDAYPHEIGWRIARVGKKRVTVKEVRPGRYTRENYTYTQNVFLKDDAVYVFEMWDDYNDGFCCDHGLGWFSIAVQDNALEIGGNTNDDATIKRTGEFTSLARQLFASAKNPTGRDLEHYLTLEIDSNSHNNLGWIIERRVGADAVSRILGDQDVEVIDFHLPGEGDPLAETEKVVPIRQGGQYALTLLEPDGACCSLSVGTYAIWLGDPDVGQLVLEGDIRDWWFPEMFGVEILYGADQEQQEQQENGNDSTPTESSSPNSSAPNSSSPDSSAAAWSIVRPSLFTFLCLILPFLTGEDFSLW